MTLQQVQAIYQDVEALFTRDIPLEELCGAIEKALNKEIVWEEVGEIGEGLGGLESYLEEDKDIYIRVHKEYGARRYLPEKHGLSGPGKVCIWIRAYDERSQRQEHWEYLRKIVAPMNEEGIIILNLISVIRVLRQQRDE